MTPVKRNFVISATDFNQAYPKAKKGVYAALKAGWDTGMFSGFNPGGLAMCLGMFAHETGNFSRFSESLNYSSTRLLEVWPSHFKDVGDVSAVVGSAEKIANRVYGSRMGNHGEASGDGYRFRGRGFIQITGRNNYEAYGSSAEFVGMFGQPLVERPDILTESLYAGLFVAMEYVRKRKGLLEAMLRGDIRGATKKINGGYHGLDDRAKQTRVFNRMINSDGSDVAADPTEEENALLHMGRIGGGVKKLQAALNIIMDKNLATDGIFGPATLKAVQLYQTLELINDDGLVGAVTWGRINDDLALLETKDV